MRSILEFSIFYFVELLLHALQSFLICRNVDQGIKRFRDLLEAVESRSTQSLRLVSIIAKMLIILPTYKICLLFCQFVIGPYKQTFWMLDIEYFVIHQGYSRKKTLGVEEALFFYPTTHGIQFPRTPTTHVIKKLRTPTTHRIQFSNGPVV